MYRPQRLADDPTRLFAAGWNPGQINGHAPRGWGKSNDNHIPQEPGACWDDSGDSTPMGLQDMSLEEKEVRRPPHYRWCSEFVLTTSRLSMR
jgi:PERQ amino acid-rich with GYF domain-containing protein